MVLKNVDWKVLEFVIVKMSESGCELAPQHMFFLPYYFRHTEVGAVKKTVQPKLVQPRVIQPTVETQKKSESEAVTAAAIAAASAVAATQPFLQVESSSFLSMRISCMNMIVVPIYNKHWAIQRDYFLRCKAAMFFFSVLDERAH